MSNPDYLNDVISDMPEVSPVAETLAQKASEAEDEKFKSNEQSTEKVPKRGRGRPRKDGSAPKVAKNQSRIGGVADAGERDRLAQDAERLAVAQFVTEMVEVSGTSIGGEAARMGELEKVSMAGCWERYFRARGISDIPPGIALTLVMGQYYVRVFSSPPAQPKVRKIFGWFKNKIKRVKDARSNRRNDRQRENDDSQATSESIQGEGN